MSAADIDEVAEIERLSQPSPWPAHLFLEEMARDWAHIELVKTRTSAGRVVIGFCNFCLVHDEVHLLNLAVHPDWRRRGIGRMLLEHLLTFARAEACQVVTLEVRESNLAARALYGSHGFAAVGLRRRYYADNGEDAVVMTLNLSR